MILKLQWANRSTVSTKRSRLYPYRWLPVCPSRTQTFSLTDMINSSRGNKKGLCLRSFPILVFLRLERILSVGVSCQSHGTLASYSQSPTSSASVCWFLSLSTPPRTRKDTKQGAFIPERHRQALPAWCYPVVVLFFRWSSSNKHIILDFKSAAYQLISDWVWACSTGGNSHLAL